MRLGQSRRPQALQSLGCAPTYPLLLSSCTDMTAHIHCNGCNASFKLAAFAPESWRAETADLQDFLEQHRPCNGRCADERFFTLRYEP
jgi:hypothetical protein